MRGDRQNSKHKKQAKGEKYYKFVFAVEKVKQSRVVGIGAMGWIVVAVAVKFVF